MSVVVVPIHGVPRLEQRTPIVQLEAVLRICNSRGLTVWDDFQWASGSLEDAGTILRLLRSETRSLVETYVGDFDRWIRTRLEAVPEDTQLAIIAYSAGGAIFYRWICEEPRTEVISRIAVIITIAAPHTFPNPVNLEELKHPKEVNEPAIPPEKIVAQLRHNRKRLVVLLGEQDETIPPKFGMFSATPEIEQEVISDARHLTICTHQRVIEIVESKLAAIS